jgi:hypothetical protein
MKAADSGGLHSFLSFPINAFSFGAIYGVRVSSEASSNAPAHLIIISSMKM